MYVMQRHVSFPTEDGTVSGRVVKSEVSREAVFVHVVMPSHYASLLEAGVSRPKCCR
jgi:hypothetical protein